MNELNTENLMEELASYISLENTPSSWLNCSNDINNSYQSNWLEKYDFERIMTFYEFEESFQNRFFKEIEILKEDKKLNYITFIMYYILFLADNKNYYNIWSWPSNNNVFKNHGSYMIPVVTLLCGFKFHLKNIKLRNFDEKQIEYQKQNIKLTCTNDNIRYGIDGIRFSQMIWGSFFMKGNLLQFGRLQYEIGVKNFEKLDKYFKRKKDYIYIHIPRGNNLDEQDVDNSLNEAKKNIKNFYPELKDLIFYTQTWLLSPELKEILPSNSNIIKFQNRFNILEYENYSKDFLDFVFDDVFDSIEYKDLPENTTLQKKLKLMLLQEKDLHLGLGILK